MRLQYAALAALAAVCPLLHAAERVEPADEDGGAAHASFKEERKVRHEMQMRNGAESPAAGAAPPILSIPW